MLIKTWYRNISSLSSLRKSAEKVFELFCSLFLECTFTSFHKSSLTHWYRHLRKQMISTSRPTDLYTRSDMNCFVEIPDCKVHKVMMVD